MSRSLGVHSEVGQLRQAIVHRPGLELSRLTPANGVFESEGSLVFEQAENRMHTIRAVLAAAFAA